MLFFKKSKEEKDLLRKLKEVRKNKNIKKVEKEQKKVKTYNSKLEKSGKKSIKEDDKDIIKLYEKFKKNLPYNPAETKGVIKKIKKHFDVAPKILIFFIRRNNDVEHHIVKSSLPYFMLYDKAYMIDTKYQRYNYSAKMNMLVYHEDIDLPLGIEVPIKTIQSAIEESGEVDLAVNPSVLARFIKSEFVEKIMKGAELARDLGLIRILLIINTIGIAVCIILTFVRIL